MVRVFAGSPALLAAAATLSALLETQQTAAMTMQLHRLPERSVHPEKYSRRLNSEDDGPEIVPLHLGLGTHYTWVYAGTPPQRASVIVDTGSGIMAFPCSGCDGCGSHTDQPFEADNSSTLVHVTCASDSFFQCKECKEVSNVCGISQSYMEGSSWKASVVEDLVYLGGDESFQDGAMRNRYGTHFQFGCQSSETGLFVTQVADGIMGLSNTDNHIVAKLHRENKIPSNLFSLCFTEKGGTMSVGEPNKLAHRGDISYAKVISDRSTKHFYNVNMKDIRIGGKSINAKPEAYTRGHYIVDSGTTDSYLPRLLKTEFLQVFKEVAGRDYQVGTSCTGFTKEDLSTLPAIQLVMEALGEDGGEVVWEIPPEQYLLNSDGTFCGSIYLSENSGGVIGANIMMDRDVIFDIGNQRVGFVDADCMYQESVAEKMSTTRPPPTNGNNNMNGSSEQDENYLVPTKTTVMAPASTSVAESVAPTSAPTPETTPASTTPASTTEATPASTPGATAASTPAATAASTPAATAASTPAAATSKPTPVAATSKPAYTPTAEVTNASSASTEVTSELNATPLSEDAKNPGTVPSSSSDGSANTKGGSSGSTHPMVLTIVGSVLVVGFLLMMLISVSRRRQNSGKEALWSRVKGNEEDEDDDDEEEFGLVRKETKPAKISTKHQRLEMEDEDDDDRSSSDEEDEVFDRKNVQSDESTLDPRTLERL